MAVTLGAPDLRYSPSCKSNWGRYTPYWRFSLWTSISVQSTIYARVTVWNPGGPSYGVAHTPLINFINGSSWSYMTDGRPTACTGVEVLLIGNHADMTSQGWNWGACHLRFINSTMLEVCRLVRANRHRVAKDVAAFGKNWQGWHYGLIQLIFQGNKLHVACNIRGQLAAVLFTTANAADSR